MLLYVWSTRRPMYLLDLRQIVTSHPVRRTQQHFTQFQQLVINWRLRVDLDVAVRFATKAFSPFVLQTK